MEPDTAGGFCATCRWLTVKKKIIMDNGNGQFNRIDEKKFLDQMGKQQPMVFKVGEILEIRGSQLLIKQITGSELVLALLPKTR